MVLLLELDQRQQGTIAADIIPASRRGEGLGYFGTSMNLAMAVGPFLGLFISRHFDQVMIFVVTTIFSVVAILATIFLHTPKVQVVTKNIQTKNRVHIRDFFEKSTIAIGHPCHFWFCLLKYFNFLKYLCSKRN